MDFKHILIAVDGTPCAAHAASVGLALAAALQAQVAFVTVVDETSVPVGVTDDDAHLLAEYEADARQLLNAFVARANSTPPCLRFLETGRAPTRIVEVARTWPADLIVMGSHGRTAVANVFLGSVAQGVIHHAPCPVTIARPGGNV